jgi:hypothetical protein
MAWPEHFRAEPVPLHTQGPSIMNDNDERGGKANERETGARKYPRTGGSDTGIDQKAAENRRPEPYGLTQPVGETSEDTAQSDNLDQSHADRE